MGIFDGAKEWLVSLAIKKSAKWIAQFIVTLVGTELVAKTLQMLGINISIDDKVLLVGLISLIGGAVEFLRNMLKTKYGIKILGIAAVFFIFTVSGCASVQPAMSISAPDIQPVSAKTPVDSVSSSNLIYEHITPYSVVAAKNKSGTPSPGAIGIDQQTWANSIVEMMKTPGWKPLMDNAPEVGWSTAGIVSAFYGTWEGIIPGLVGIPFRSFQKVLEANYDMQQEIRKLDDMLVSAGIASGNQCEIVRAYLPAHSKEVKIRDGTLEVTATGAGVETKAVKDEASTPIQP